MKRIIAFLLLLFIGCVCTACATANQPAPTSSPTSSANASSPLAGKKILVAYFSATGNTKHVAEEIAQATGADIFRIEAADPYASNPYQDSDRIKAEAFGNQRPAVKTLLPKEEMSKYDVIFIGSPTWWHQPAMVVCTFLESYDLKGKTIIPFFTYGSRDYLNESMQRIYKSTPNSEHLPKTLPTDLDPDNIQEVQHDDAGILMPDDVSTIHDWLHALGL